MRAEVRGGFIRPGGMSEAAKVGSSPPLQLSAPRSISQLRSCRRWLKRCSPPKALICIRAVDFLSPSTKYQVATRKNVNRFRFAPIWITSVSGYPGEACVRATRCNGLEPVLLRTADTKGATRGRARLTHR